MPGFSIGNMIIPFFAFAPLAQLYLLIPVVLLEAWVVKRVMKASYLQALPAVFAANLLSTVCGIVLFPLDFLGQGLAHFTSSELFGLLIILFLFPLCFFISFYVERRVYFRRWKDEPRKQVSKAALLSNLATYLPLLVAMWFLSAQYSDKRYERVHRIACKSNLKQIGIALAQYATDNNGYFPNARGAAGLEMLRSQNYLTDCLAFLCYSDKARRKSISPEEGQPLSEKNLSYLYFGDGLKAERASTRPIACDKPGNHKDYGNVLFSDGGVRDFSGATWLQDAGIKIEEAEK